MTQKERLIYLAGIIDGEGTISIVRSGRYRARNYYYITLQISNTDIELFKWIEKYFGGKRRPIIIGDRKRKPIYRWSIFGKKAAEIIKKVESFLLLKKKHAKLVLKFFGENYKRNKKNKFLSEEVILKREKYVKIIRKLNKKGPGFK